MISRPCCPLRLPGLVLALMACAVSPLAAAPQAEHIKQGKRTTALLVVPGKGFATAFCIDAEGFFITNEHAVRGITADSTLTLVLNPAETDQKVMEAHVARVDRDLDLALLKVDGIKDLPTLELGDTKNLIETAEIVAFGYPFGTALAVKRREYPSISVNVGRITALRKSEGRLETIQTDAVLNFGNSGGPVIDAEGKVIGVVNAGIQSVRGGGAGVNFAIPVDRVHAFLAQPQIVFTTPTVPFDKRHDDLKLEARITTFNRQKQEFDVVLEVADGKGGQRVIKAKRDKDRFTLRFKPVEASEAISTLPVELLFESGSIRGQVKDMTVIIGDAKPSLADISRLQRKEGDTWQVQFKDGKQATGELKLGKVEVELGGATVTVDAARVSAMVVYEPPAPPGELSYTLTVQREGKTVATQAGKIILGPPPAKVIVSVGEAPGVGRTAGYEPPAGKATFDEGRVKIKLSEGYSAFTVAGAGRYFAYHLKSAEKIVILDALEGKVVHEIPNVPTDVLMAGGRDKLVLVFPGQKLMQRWRLAPFEREKTAPMPAKGTARRAILGEDSRGPLLVVAEDAAFVDLETMRPMKVEGEILGAMFGSAQGGTYTDSAYWNYLRMRLDGLHSIVDKFGTGQGEAGRWARLSADGSLLWTKGPNLYTGTGKRLETKWLDGCTIFATVDPRFFIAVKFEHDPQRKRAVTHFNICTTADRRIVHTIVGLEDMAPTGNSNQYNDVLHRLFNGEERFHYIPWANLIVTHSWGGDIITLEKFNLIASLEQTGVDYLYVTSIPPTNAYRGRTFTHDLAVTSKAGGVTYTLESGPKDLTLSPAGGLRWDVPTHTAETAANVIVRVNDRAGSELFHSFELVIEDAPATIIEGTVKP